MQGHQRAGAVPGLISGTLLAPRAAFEKVGGFDPGLWFADAADWFLRAEAKGLRVARLPEVLHFHRMHGSNITRRRFEDSKHEFLGLARRKLRAQSANGTPTGPSPEVDGG
ncbi:MAG: hypothetical protein LJE84_04665 [Gammaproteobacteria bacterium]|nr:hypothetical protein [Gammaproteobacteria bacterium]